MNPVARICVLALGAAFCCGASAQNFPSKPIHIIVPFPPGGSLDATVRAVAAPMSESIGQPVIVDNRPGGATYIGMVACAKAPPDGYTLCATTPDSLVYNPYLYKDVPYDADKDFVGITNLTFTGVAMVYTRAGSRFSSIRDVIAEAKAKPGTINFSTWGPGSAADLYSRYLNKALSLDIVQIPYKGAAPALAAGLAGDVELGFWGVGGLMAQIKGGKVRPLLVTSARRTPLLPDVPAFSDIGIEDPHIVQYFGVFAPARPPAAVMDRLHTEIAKALHTPAVEKFLASQTFEAIGNTPAEFNAYVKADRENAGRLLKSLGVKPLDAAN